MNFKEMMTFWTLKGVVKRVNTGARAKADDSKRIKIRLAPAHSIYVRYDDRGPINASLYYNDGEKFYLEDRVGIPQAVPYQQTMKQINLWIKELK